jgi:hypothetical protein
VCGCRIPMSVWCCDGQSDPTVSESLANEEVTVRADGRGAEARRVQEIDAVASSADGAVRSCGAFD